MQVIGIDATKKVLGDVTAMVVDGIGIAKNGVNFLKDFAAILDLMKEVKLLIVDVKGAVPELKDLSAEEIADLGPVAFDCFQKVYAAIVK